MKTVSLLFISFLLVNATLAQHFTDLYGDYLGQPLPNDTPVVFAPGIISTDDLEHSPAMFIPDGNEVYWISNKPPGPENNKWTGGTLMMKRINGRWTEPQDAPYKLWTLSPDGNRGYFTSMENKDIWITVKQNDKWSEPRCLNFIIQYPELQFAYISSISRDGNLYFTAYLEGPKNNYGIYRSKLINSKYAKPEALPGNINMAGLLNWTPFVDPDENYIIFSSNRHNQHDAGDLYISFHDISADTWSNPVNMGEPINTGSQERFPCISPDGKYLFFTRWISKNNHDVFWTSAGIIERIRERNITQ